MLEIKIHQKTRSQNWIILLSSFGFLVFILLFLNSSPLILAQTSTSTSSTTTQATTTNGNGLQCNTREECEALLKKYETMIVQYGEDITKSEKEKKTLNNQISLLKKKIEKLNLQINQSTLVVKDLGLQIKDTEGSIDKTSNKIDNSKAKLSSILRTMYEEDQKSMVEVLLSEAKLSAFFDNIVALEALDMETKEVLKGIKELKITLEDQKTTLDSDKSEMERMLIVQQLQKKESEGTKKTQETYLKLTEAEYQKSLKEKKEAEKIASDIRARIFELIGVPQAPTFGEALEIAKYVNTLTGVRPAFLLAVLTQESNVGKNVGQCFLKDTKTGTGVSAKTGKEVLKVMSPTRDVPYFLEITKKLGRNYTDTPVSCPMSVGWGGAMGPAQFIPDTWGNPNYGYGLKVEAITGKPADPWSIKDAFLASGLYLEALGAKTDEFKAAMRYFSGGSWSKWEEFYGRSVLSIASQYEEDIKKIE